MRTPLSRVVAIRALQEDAERITLERYAAELNRVRTLVQKAREDGRDQMRLAFFARLSGAADAYHAYEFEADAAHRHLLRLKNSEADLLIACEQQKLVHQQARLRMREAEVLQQSGAEELRKQQLRSEQARLDEWFLLCKADLSRAPVD